MWRAIWHEPQQWWPSHQDFTTETAANQFALETSTRIGDEVSVRHIGNDQPTVCIAHGRFIPCRKDGEHRYTSNPFWVKSVNDYQTSSIEGLTWEPAP